LELLRIFFSGKGFLVEILYNPYQGLKR
jgi:hypothetical protein